MALALERKKERMLVILREGLARMNKCKVLVWEKFKSSLVGFGVVTFING